MAVWSEGVEEQLIPIISTVLGPVNVIGWISGLN